MALLEAEAFVEAVGVEALLVGGQLRHAAAARPALVERPLDHLAAKTLAALAGNDVHRLDEAAPHAEAIEPGDEGELDGADRRAVELGDDQTLVGIGGDGVEGDEVGGVVWLVGEVVGGDDTVFDHEADDEGEVVAGGVAIAEAGHRLTGIAD